MPEQILELEIVQPSPYQLTGESVEFHVALARSPSFLTPATEGRLHDCLIVGWIIGHNRRRLLKRQNPVWLGTVDVIVQSFLKLCLGIKFRSFLVDEAKEEIAVGVFGLARHVE